MKRPNLLFVGFDQLRHDCVGYAGKLPVQTPNIDRLAADGVSFEQAYCAVPTCCPTRQAMLHGARAETFGAYWNYDITLPCASLAPDQYTWSSHLQKLGYRSAYVGKWHASERHTPLDFGYQEYYGEEAYYSYWRNKYPSLRYAGDWFGEEEKLPKEDVRCFYFAEQAVRVLERYQYGTQPWHLRVDFPEPHLPCVPLPEYLERYDPKVLEPWPNFLDSFIDKPYIQQQQILNWNQQGYTWEQWRERIWRYYAVMTQVDEALGRIIEKLKEIGQYEDTLIVLTSDHGDMLGAHGQMCKHYVMYDEVLRVPLLISWPRRFESHQTNAMCVNALDIPPTLLDLLGEARPPHFCGQSLVPVLDGIAEEARQELYCSYNGNQMGLFCQRAYVNKHYKYVWNPTDVDELYDRENDPGEMRNLIRSVRHREILAQCRERLYHLLKNDGDWLLKGKWLEPQLLENHKK